jgi:taurine dioxygenase
MRITDLLALVIVLPATVLVKSVAGGPVPTIVTTMRDSATPGAGGGVAGVHVVHVDSAAVAPCAGDAPMSASCVGAYPTTVPSIVQNDSNGIAPQLGIQESSDDATSTDGRHRDIDRDTDGDAVRLQATPLSAAIGVEVKLVDGSALNLTQAWNDAVHDQIATLLLQHKLLLFRDQELSPEMQLAMAKKLGPVPPHPLGSREEDAAEDKMPQGVVVLKNTKGREQEARNDMWHSDVSCVETPTAVNLLYAADYQLLPGFGDTLFANMERAWDSLSAGMQEKVKTLDAYHSTHRFETASPLEPLKVSTGTYHPAVRSHPETCRDSLYISPTFFDHYKDLDEEEGSKLQEELTQIATNPENTYRHRWTTGDFIIFDNRDTMHYAVFDYEAGQTRTMHSARTAMQERPFSKHRPAGDNAAARTCGAK